MNAVKVQLGEVYLDKVTNTPKPYPNKTKKFLLPCLKEYGTEFTNRINSVFKVASGIGDIVVDNCGLKFEKHLFILLDYRIANNYFMSFIDWIKDQPMYQDDYVFGDIQTTTHHMIVIKLPERFQTKTLSSFKIGKYSEMYEAKDIETLFSTAPDVKKVLIRDHEYRIEFTKRLNKIFHTNIDPDKYDGEASLPPEDDKEIFNYHLKQ